MTDSQVPQPVPERISFPDEETRILEYWRAIDAFKRSNQLSEGRPIFSFYDGPPFATGLPHYGHILAGTIKDTVTRYAYQTGHHVPRRFGWDCHGLPVEMEIEKKLGIRTKEDVMELGIPKYNEECRKIVMRYAKEWETIVERMGRWIDFENDYKTLDTSFMESVWWVFKQLYDKDFVYQGLKILPYSTGCTTPLSNFEANLNYKDTNDPAVTVAFPLVDEPDVSFLVWTTTPWTLPSNLALCINPEFSYLQITDEKSGSKYILAQERLRQLYKNPQKKKGFLINKKMTGSELLGKKYVPLFDYFKDEYEGRAFKVVGDSYVTKDDGTGIVHQAPAFGEDDYRVCLVNNIIDKGKTVPCPVDANGRFVDPVSDFIGLHVKEADAQIISKIKNSGRLVKHDSITHSYPFCWRSNTPLIYMAIPAWFVKVESVKEKLVANNKTVRWVPGVVGSNRLGSWLGNTRDWNISRNRYWGTPIPIWGNEETGERLVIGSITELERLSGKSGLTDIHRDSIDSIKIISPTTGNVLTRIPEVFDCWFESGSMPYASKHYPFDEASETSFKHAFPADFIAEGLDQTRGWFYTLLVISTILFDCAPYKNVVVNGLVLAEDGKKMSKSLKNYPDPAKVINEYGADALRLYLINSPVVRAEPLRFREQGVRDVLKEVMLPWFNAYRFFVQNVRMLNDRTKKALRLAEGKTLAHAKNPMDKWIESAKNSLTAFFRSEMSCYRLYTVVPQLVTFIDSLTNWYVRLNRSRLKGTSGSVEENRAALATLGGVLMSLCRLMAPFCPYFSENIYRNLKCLADESEQTDSVHFLMIPDVDESKVDVEGENAVKHLQEVINLGRKAREHRLISLKQPLRCVEVVHRSEKVLEMVRSLDSYVKQELNVREVKYSCKEAAFVDLKADADGRVLGKKLGKNFKRVHNGIRNLTSEQVWNLEADGQITIEGITVQQSDVKIRRELKQGTGMDDVQIEASSTGSGLLVVLHTTQDAALVKEGLMREAINRIQKLRKTCGLDPGDRVEVFVTTRDDELASVVCDLSEEFKKALNAPVNVRDEVPEGLVVLGWGADSVNGHPMKITLVRAALTPDVVSIAKLMDDEKTANFIGLAVQCRGKQGLGIRSAGPSDFPIVVRMEEKVIRVSLEMGVHVFESHWDLLNSKKP